MSKAVSSDPVRRTYLFPEGKRTNRKTGGFLRNAIVAFLDGVRTFGSPEFRKNMTDFGDWNIRAIYIGRQPVDANILRVVNMMTLGSFNKNASRLKYDKVYHLYALLNIYNPNGVATPEGGLAPGGGATDGTQSTFLKLHKEEVVQLQHLNKKSFEELKHPHGDGFKIVDLDIPLITFVHNAEKKLGTEKFFEYNAITLNCQHFILNLLEANGIRSDSNRKFIVQDALALINHNPVVNVALKAITNLGALFNRIRFGTGADGGALDDFSDLLV